MLKSWNWCVHLKWLFFYMLRFLIKLTRIKVATANCPVMHALNEPYIGGGKPIFLQALYYLTQRHGRYWNSVIMPNMIAFYFTVNYIEKLWHVASSGCFVGRNMMKLYIAGCRRCFIYVSVHSYFIMRLNATEKATHVFLVL